MFSSAKILEKVGTRDSNHQNGGFWVPSTIFFKKVTDRNSVQVTELRSLSIFFSQRPNFNTIYQGTMFQSVWKLKKKNLKKELMFTSF